MEKRLYQLSKIISYILRHAPWEYGLKLDKDGWVSINELLISLAKEKSIWSNLTIDCLNQLINQYEKKRFEISGDKIRALYGHSTPVKLIKEKATPPPILYHGTDPKLLSFIMKEGLKPKHRHYVHLSVDLETAKQVGNRKAKNPVVLTIDAGKANVDGVSFYYGSEKVWLADIIPFEYIE